MVGMKAIETRFAGYRFRSRLEARWAVFFTTLGIEWRYEAEGFDLDGIRYLPDFWLPRERTWVEVKGGEPTPQERAKIDALWDAACQDRKAAYVTLASERGDDGYLPIDLPAHVAVDVVTLVGEPWFEDGRPAYALQSRAFSKTFRSVHPFAWALCPVCVRLVPLDHRGRGMNCLWCDVWERKHDHPGRFGEFYKGDSRLLEDTHDLWFTPQMQRAYAAARGARFEHGERA